VEFCQLFSTDAYYLKLGGRVVGWRIQIEWDGSHPSCSESLALLGSLTDELEFGGEVAGKTLVCMVKYRSSMGGI